MAASFRFAGALVAVAMLPALHASAQVKVGLLSTNLSGNIAPSYSANFGNMTPSDHAWQLGGAGTLSGSFYNPNFLSFNANFYLNQSRSNSGFQSISNASGIDASATIFGGSTFPGSINYSKAFNSEGNYGIPGLADYVTHGDSSTFGVAWNENLPDAPSFSASFQMGSSQYSVYGTNDSGSNAFHSINLHSGYHFAGFTVGGFYSDGAGHSLVPQVVSGATNSQIQSDNDTYGFSVSHVLPLQGSISGGLTRSSWNSDFLGTDSTGTIDLLNAQAAVHPTQKLSISGSASYSDNLSGQLIQSVVSTGGVVPGFNSSQASNSLDLMGAAGYTPTMNLPLQLSVERRKQTFLGQTYEQTSYGLSAAYSHELRNGALNSSFTLTDNTSDQSSQNSLGFSTTDSYSSIVRGWHVTGTFGYAQNVQTLLVTYTNSSYHFSGNLRRAWGKLNVSGGASMARTALTQEPDTANSSENFNTNIGYGMWISVGGSYSRSSGQALATGAGLIPVPIPTPVLPPGAISLFGGDSYSFSVSSTPRKRLILAASYAHSASNTANSLVASANQNNQFNTLITYQTRKLNFNSGFARLEQGFSGAGATPQVISSYSIGVSRWFKFF